MLTNLVRQHLTKRGKNKDEINDNLRLNNRIVENECS